MSELTMSQLEDMDDDAYDTIIDELNWAEQDAHEERRRRIAEQMEQCNHEHTVGFDEPKAGKGGMIDGYCEDCDKEFLAE